ncbi:DUF1552 domain-containing protein [Roseiconus lacunae]|uniref:DUF1552 domain-containing protein n=1 Tax=Roseiconus lacunae TaxID=2605694 RepID=A0ABT7PJ06_9BACT|nr:DUF1552 domain-containing protein [Roseiconus lacunae]MCD0458576.1 DUF1552 domain-containing protein [Roseiconus lacunae]MDM4016464.1 DUF1552 domain-containing protein [Roseiconus lacunae]WRQ51935.1 DUF1552 domain-containing protein [Stieleria sp. HD01]
MRFDGPFRRRTFLRGLGTTIALPWLESRASATELAGQSIPRMGMFYFGTGMNMRQFYPEGFGRQAKLSRILEPLEKHRDQFTVLSGTYLEHGGGHDGAYPFATGIARGEKQIASPDQLAAAVHGSQTRFPSLQLSVKRGTGFGSQALATISWNQQGVPLAAENDPKTIFNRLFKADSADDQLAKADDFRQRRSVLDAVLEDARDIQPKISRDDRRQLDQYLHAIREVEIGLSREIDWSDRPKPQPKLDHLGDYENAVSPEGNGKFLYDDYAKLMYDLIALAFQTDSTRVVTYVVRTELAGGVYPEFGVSKGYHELTHHGNDPSNLEQLAKVDTIYMKHWSYFLDRLASIREGQGTLLDQTMLGFSSGMGIGHSKAILPTVLSGGRGLGINHQTHLQLSENTPLSTLWQTMADRMGVDTDGPGNQETFQDSPGIINELIT